MPSSIAYPCFFIPFILDDLPEAVHHAIVPIHPGDLHVRLNLSAFQYQLLCASPLPLGLSMFVFLHSRLDHVQRVHDQNLTHAGHRTGHELVDEG